MPIKQRDDMVRGYIRIIIFEVDTSCQLAEKMCRGHVYRIMYGIELHVGWLRR